MSALGCFGRFTLFSPRVSHSYTCRLLSFVCFVLLFGFVALVCFCFLFFALLCFWFLFCKCLGIPNSPRSLDLDDRQGLIARSAMQQKKKKDNSDRPCYLLWPIRGGNGQFLLVDPWLMPVTASTWTPSSTHSMHLANEFDARP